MIRPLVFAFLTVFLFAVLPAKAQDAEAPEPAMTLDRLEQIILRLDPEAQRQGGAMQFTVEDVPVIIVTDERADRMRAMTPIRSADALTPEELARMMQANFDTALDARYAIANGRLWSAFIHPLSPLERTQFISAIGQVVNLALTYGSLYSGGGVAFGGGDSQGLQRALIEELLKKGEPI